MSNCFECKHVNKTVHMKLDDDVLYNVWCKIGDIGDENCSKYVKVKGINTQNRKSKGCKSL